MGGTGTEAVDDLTKAFFKLANEPLRGCKKPPPVELEMDVPAVTMEDDEPLLNFPSLLSSTP